MNGYFANRVLANCPGDRDSIPGRVILLKLYLISLCFTLSIIRYLSRVKKSNPVKGVVSSSTPWCSSYWKGSLQVTLDYGCQLLLYHLVNGVEDHFPLNLMIRKRISENLSLEFRIFKVSPKISLQFLQFTKRPWRPASRCCNFLKMSLKARSQFSHFFQASVKTS